MPAATRTGGPLVPIKNCYIEIPGFGKLEMKVLPEISDSKSANYSDEPIIGRSFPLKTYSHSDNRAISMTIHMIVSQPSDLDYNIRALRAVQSAVYPRHGFGDAPYAPPPVCQIKCGRLLAETDLCVVLKQYSVKFPTEVAWDENSFVPFKFDIETSWEVVYKSSILPGAERIFLTGGGV